MLAKAKGYHFLAVVDPKTTPENIEAMRLLGAQVETVDQLDINGSYLLTRLKYIHELCHTSSNYIWSNQYENIANPYIHYTQTGPEIYRQMHGKVDAIFIAVSTGGTLAGIGRYFREMSLRTQIIGVDVRGSVIFGTPPAPRKLTGIGSSRTSNFLQREHYDTYRIISDEEAFAFCRLLYNETNIKVGGSSGAVLAACAQYVEEHSEIKHLVCLCPDTGENYTSSIFNDQWLRQQQLDVINPPATHLESVSNSRSRR
jgi:cysteine synthase